MASDITLAVGDGARRMTYAELAAVRGTSQPSAERLVRRRGWPRQVGNDGVVRVLVPLTEARNVSNSAVGALAPDNREVAPAPVETSPGQMAPDDRGLVRGLENAIEALQEQLQFINTSLIAERQRVDELLHQLAEAPERGSVTDPMTAIGIQTLSQAVEMLRQDVDRERDRADHAERQVEAERQEGRKRIDALQASLADERRRIDGLYIDLADARTAAMITGCEAAALRSRLDLLTGRRPWWRRFAVKPGSGRKRTLALAFLLTTGATKAAAQTEQCPQMLLCRDYYGARQDCATAGNFDLCLDVKMGTAKRRAAATSCTDDEQPRGADPSTLPSLFDCALNARSAFSGSVSDEERR